MVQPENVAEPAPAATERKIYVMAFLTALATKCLSSAEALRCNPDVRDRIVPGTIRNNPACAFAFLSISMLGGPIPQLFQSMYAEYHQTPANSPITGLKRVMGGTSARLLCKLYDLYTTWMVELFKPPSLRDLASRYESCPPAETDRMVVSWALAHYGIIAQKVAEIPFGGTGGNDRYDPDLVLINATLSVQTPSVASDEASE